MNPPGISIVIPAYNEEKFILVTLQAVQAARKFFSSHYDLGTEIVVVNNASTDQTKSIAEKHGARVIDHEVRNISSVRNIGIRNANFEIIVMIDADCFLPEDGLVKVWQAMNAQALVGGALGVRVISSRWQVRVAAKVIQSLVVCISGIYGAMFFFSKQDALAMGGFPENRLIAEDSAFAISLRAHGRKQGKKFIRLKSVQVGTLDRKDTNFLTVATVFWQVLVAFLGRKQRAEDLKYWYDPKR